MKLDNKGFAITSVLYGLLILFVILTSSYLAVLGAKSNRLDVITDDISSKYSLEKLTEPNKQITTSGYRTEYDGKYVFSITNSRYLNVSFECFTYLPKDYEIKLFCSDSFCHLVYNNNYISLFGDANCSNISDQNNIRLTKIYYNGVDSE